MTNPIKKEHVEKIKTLIIVSATMLVVGFISGTHTERNTQAAMKQQYVNGASSVEVKK